MQKQFCWAAAISAFCLEFVLKASDTLEPDKDWRQLTIQMLSTYLQIPLTEWAELFVVVIDSNQTLLMFAVYSTIFVADQILCL